MSNLVKSLLAIATLTAAVSITSASLPDPGMQIEAGRTALVITDPQNDFLSPKGVTWGVVGKSVTENNTVENIETLLKTAKPTTSLSSFLHTTTTRTIMAGALKEHSKN